MKIHHSFLCILGEDYQKVEDVTQFLQDAVEDGEEGAVVALEKHGALEAICATYASIPFENSFFLTLYEDEVEDAAILFFSEKLDGVEFKEGSSSFRLDQPLAQRYDGRQVVLAVAISPDEEEMTIRDFHLWVASVENEDISIEDIRAAKDAFDSKTYCVVLLLEEKDSKKANICIITKNFVHESPHFFKIPECHFVSEEGAESDDNDADEGILIDSVHKRSEESKLVPGEAEEIMKQEEEEESEQESEPEVPVEPADRTGEGLSTVSATSTDEDMEEDVPESVGVPPPYEDPSLEPASESVIEDKKTIDEPEEASKPELKAKIDEDTEAKDISRRTEALEAFERKMGTIEVRKDSELLPSLIYLQNRVNRLLMSIPVDSLSSESDTVAEEEEEAYGVEDLSEDDEIIDAEAIEEPPIVNLMNRKKATRDLVSMKPLYRRFIVAKDHKVLMAYHGDLEGGLETCSKFSGIGNCFIEISSRKPVLVVYVNGGGDAYLALFRDGDNVLIPPPDTSPFHIGELSEHSAPKEVESVGCQTDETDYMKTIRQGIYDEINEAEKKNREEEEKQRLKELEIRERILEELAAAELEKNQLKKREEELERKLRERIMGEIGSNEEDVANEDQIEKVAVEPEIPLETEFSSSEEVVASESNAERDGDGDSVEDISMKMEEEVLSESEEEEEEADAQQAGSDIQKLREEVASRDVELTKLKEFQRQSTLKQMNEINDLKEEMMKQAEEMTKAREEVISASKKLVAEEKPKSQELSPASPQNTETIAEEVDSESDDEQGKYEDGSETQVNPLIQSVVKPANPTPAATVVASVPQVMNIATSQKEVPEHKPLVQSVVVAPSQQPIQEIPVAQTILHAQVGAQEEAVQIPQRVQRQNTQPISVADVQTEERLIVNQQVNPQEQVHPQASPSAPLAQSVVVSPQQPVLVQRPLAQTVVHQQPGMPGVVYPGQAPLYYQQHYPPQQTGQVEQSKKSKKSKKKDKKSNPVPIAPQSSFGSEGSPQMGTMTRDGRILYAPRQVPQNYVQPGQQVQRNYVQPGQQVQPIHSTAYQNPGQVQQHPQNYQQFVTKQAPLSKKEKKKKKKKEKDAAKGEAVLQENPNYRVSRSADGKIQITGKPGQIVPLQMRDKSGKMVVVNYKIPGSSMSVSARDMINSSSKKGKKVQSQRPQVLQQSQQPQVLQQSQQPQALQQTAPAPVQYPDAGAVPDQASSMYPDY